MKKLAAAAALTGAAALITPTLALPADAATRTIHDKVGDDRLGNGVADMKYVRVHYGAKMIRFRIQWSQNGSPEDYQNVYLDLNPRRKGPEANIFVNTAETETWDFGRVKNWHPWDWATTASGKEKYGVEHGVQYVRFSIPAKLIKRKGHAQPRRIRVSVADRDETDQAYDWTPAKKKWSRWIHWK